MSTSQILVVEDEGIVATAIKNELEQFGYEVPDMASSADEAVEKAVREKPDLVLMDIHLKGEKDGIAAAREIHDRCGIPIVYLSAFADAETVARAGDTGAFGYLLKPYEERELRTTIEMALAKHRAEQQLAETERWLVAMLEGIDDAVIATDPENRIRFINLAGEALTGWRKEDAVGAPLAAVFSLVDERGRVSLERLADRTVRESRLVDLPATARLVARNGQETPVEGSLSPIYDPHGAFLGIALTLRNIRVRLELERVRRQGEEQKRQSQKREAVRRLAGGMAHHLNNLLTVILGNMALVRLRPFYEDAITEALSRAEDAGHRAADLIQRLLIFSGQGRGHLQQVNLPDFLHEFMNETRPLLDSRIDLAVRSDGELWPIWADEVQVGQAFLNLCLNAQDAMPEGGQLTLECRNVRLEEEDLATRPDGRVGDYLRVRISDTGKGMAPEVRARLFEPFFTTKEQGQGVGLGLAFVFAVVEQHHGWIEYSSEVGRGTRFDLYFPRFGADAPEKSHSIKPAKLRGTKPTILVAEPEPMVRDFARLVLEAQGYRVLVADDGVQAVEVFQQAPEQIDLVIIDLNIPRLPGDVVLKHLMELDPNIEVIFSSGYFAEDRCAEGRHQAGVISKPYPQAALVRMVEQALAGQSEKSRT